MSNAPPTQTPRGDESALTRKQQMLLDYLRECEVGADSSDSHGAPNCPVCGYNLHGLTKPTCPECGKELALTVGAARHPIGWLLAALAPGFFSGIAACFVLIPIFGRLLFGDGRTELWLNALDLFGWCSGAGAIIIAVKRARFLALSPVRQRWIALTIWLIHIAALGVFILLAVMFM